VWGPLGRGLGLPMLAPPFSLPGLVGSFMSDLSNDITKSERTRATRVRVREGRARWVIFEDSRARAHTEPRATRYERDRTNRDTRRARTMGAGARDE
jgi:hypothetical protein